MHTQVTNVNTIYTKRRPNLILTGWFKQIDFLSISLTIIEDAPTEGSIIQRSMYKITKLYDDSLCLIKVLHVLSRDPLFSFSMIV